MKKKVLSFLVSLGLVVSIIQPAAFAAEFSDMPNNWATKALEHAAANGLLTGYEGKIMPDDNLTRAQMATIINRAFGATEKASLENYSDVATDKWYYAEMGKAVQMKTFIGSEGKLNPANNITREEAFTVISRTFKLSQDDKSVLNKFSDKALISAWAENGIAALVEKGYVSGSEGKLNPKQNMTRAEFAKIMYSLLNTYITKAGTYTEIAEGSVMINVPNVILKGVTVKGNLIIGDGVGDGDVTLDNVIVTGETIIRGGGVNSIRVIGNSQMGNIVIARVRGEVRVYAEDGSEIGQVTADGSDDIIIEGNIESLEILSPNINVTATNAEITSAIVSGQNSTINVGATSTIGTVSINAQNSNIEVLGQVTNIQTSNQAGNATITVSSGATVGNIQVNSNNTNISGSGNVGSVAANANNVSVTTPKTSVTAGEGTTGVTARNK